MTPLLPADFTQPSLQIILRIILDGTILPDLSRGNYMNLSDYVINTCYYFTKIIKMI